MILKVMQQGIDFFMEGGIDRITIGSICRRDEIVRAEPIVFDAGDYDLTGEKASPDTTYRVIFVEKKGSVHRVLVDTVVYILNDNGETVEVVRV